jgi:hypothetical protein
VVIKSSVFRDMTPCSPFSGSKNNSSKKPARSRQQTENPKYMLTLNELHDIISQKAELCVGECVFSAPSKFQNHRIRRHTQKHLNMQDCFVV